MNNTTAAVKQVRAGESRRAKKHRSSQEMLGGVIHFNYRCNYQRTRSVGYCICSPGDRYRKTARSALRTGWPGTYSRVLTLDLT